MHIYDPIADILGLTPFDVDIDVSEFQLKLTMSYEPWNKGRKCPEARHGFIKYNERKRVEGYTPEELAKKSKAGRARKGKVMSDEGRASYSKAATIRQKNAPVIQCEHCGHQQKRSPNFYLYHGKRCALS